MANKRFIVSGDLSSFHEAIKAGRIDREAGVIKGVKLMGFESKNDRRYNTPSAHLFDGVKVRLNHYAKEDDPNPPDPGFEDIWATTVNSIVTAEGVFADLKYNKAHPMVPTILWWAENQPNVGGFSPITWGMHTVDQNGETVITIMAVESVDLVDRPATTNGFFEEVHDMDPKEVVKLQESLVAKTAEAVTLSTSLATEKTAREAAETRANEAEAKLTAAAEAERKAVKRAERLKLIKDAELGEVSSKFTEAVVAAADDETAKTIVETLKEKLGAPRSVSSDANDATGNGTKKSVESYEDAKKSGVLEYRSAV